MTRRHTIALLGMLAALVARPVTAMTVLPLDLTELTAGAGTIFVGRVTRVDPGVDAQGIAAVWTTFAIEETLKGATGPTLTLKQLGTRLGTGGGANGSPGGASGSPSGARAFPSVPRFAPGESVMLFVHPVSALGFASPVGLGQGAFRIRDQDGRRVVTNDVANRNLDAAARGAASTTDQGAAASGALPLDALVARVRGLVDATP